MGWRILTRLENDERESWQVREKERKKRNKNEGKYANKEKEIRRS